MFFSMFVLILGIFLFFVIFLFWVKESVFFFF